MNCSFIKHDQNQQHLLPNPIMDWVKGESLERFVSDVLDPLDNEGLLKPFYPEQREAGRPRPSYPPLVLLKLLVFGYCLGVRSSQKLDRLLERDNAFRYLAANQRLISAH